MKKKKIKKNKHKKQLPGKTLFLGPRLSQSSLLQYSVHHFSQEMKGVHRTCQTSKGINRTLSEALKKVSKKRSGMYTFNSGHVTKYMDIKTSKSKYSKYKLKRSMCWEKKSVFHNRKPWIRVPGIFKPNNSMLNSESNDICQTLFHRF